jgi:hypothetical protein
MHVKQAWTACPKGCLPMVLGDLNANLAASRDKQDKTITKQVDNMNLVNMSRHLRNARELIPTVDGRGG